MDRKLELEKFYKKAVGITNYDYHTNSEKIKKIKEECVKFTVSVSELRILIDTEKPRHSVHLFETIYEDMLGLQLDVQVDKLSYINEFIMKNLLNCTASKRTIQEIYNAIRNSEGFKTY